MHRHGVKGEESSKAEAELLPGSGNKRRKSKFAFFLIPGRWVGTGGGGFVCPYQTEDEAGRDPGVFSAWRKAAIVPSAAFLSPLPPPHHVAARPAWPPPPPHHHRSLVMDGQTDRWTDSAMPWADQSRVPTMSMCPSQRHPRKDVGQGRLQPEAPSPCSSKEGLEVVPVLLSCPGQQWTGP